MSIAINGTNGITFNDGSLQPSAIGKNLIINGNMQIAQRATSVTGITTGGYYTVDRWQTNTGTGGTWTQSQDSDVPNGQGFGNSLKYSCTTANASLSADSNFNLCHRFEGQNLQQLKKGTANAESVTVSFWVKSNKTGAYVFELWDRDNDRHIANTYTISSAGTWEKKTLTYVGDTSGAFGNDNGKSLEANWWLVAGTNYTSGTSPTTWTGRADANRAVGQTVNLADSTSNYINITGVQLEANTTATPFEHLPYDVNLQRCLRYCYQQTLIDARENIALVTAYTAGSCFAVFRYPVQMRASPSFTVSDATIFDVLAAASNRPVTAMSVAHVTTHNAQLSATISVALTQGFSGWLRGDNSFTPDGTQFIKFDAEL